MGANRMSDSWPRSSLLSSQRSINSYLFKACSGPRLRSSPNSAKYTRACFLNFDKANFLTFLSERQMAPKEPHNRNFSGQKYDRQVYCKSKASIVSSNPRKEKERLNEEALEKESEEIGTLKYL